LKIHINISHITLRGTGTFLSLFKLVQVSFSSSPDVSASVFLVHFVQLNQMTQSQHGGISFYYEQQFKQPEASKCLLLLAGLFASKSGCEIT
jgi:hypothetical protein